MRTTLARMALATAVACVLIRQVHGGQHLVRPGDDWSQLAPELAPGDEVILMPGEHRFAQLENLRGERGKPITIRSVAPHARAVIVAEQDGLTLIQPQFVVIENIHIRDASLCGLRIEGHTDSLMSEVASSAAGESAAAAVGEPWLANLIIRDVLIERVGPQGNRHSICLNGVRRVDLEQCRIEGWGGAAVEIVGCQDITISGCMLKGLPDHGQQCGVQMRGGSANVRIELSRFESVGLYAVLFGGRSAPEEFCPPLLEAAAAASAFEARSCYVEKTLILGGSNAFGFFSASECLARNCTIIRPRGAVLVLGHDAADARVGPAQRCIFGANLVLWKPGDLTALAIADPAADAQSFVLEPNLWWSPDLADQRAALGELPGESTWEQIWDVNPQLDASFKPASPDAASFGCVTP